MRYDPVLISGVNALLQLWRQKCKGCHNAHARARRVQIPGGAASVLFIYFLGWGVVLTCGMDFRCDEDDDDDEAL